MKSIYERLGIDPHKDGVREVFGATNDNDFPGAFCNIVRDPENPGMVMCKHPDGDGSKSLQRILHFLETGDESVFQGAVDDAWSMNTGDIAASGFVSGLFMMTDVIAINGINLPKKQILKQFALRIAALKQLYRDHGFNLLFLGGETADLPDQTPSIVLDMDVWARAFEVDIIQGNIQDGDKIWGFASDGMAVWEDKENSSLGSNGLTMGRIKLMHSSYRERYPFLCRQGGGFEGRFMVNDQPDILGGMTVSEALMSPTRQWAIVIKMIIDKLRERDALHLLHGISMNTGGGVSKVRALGTGGIVFHKTLPPLPPIFQLIMNETGETMANMLTTFNCGVGIDIVGDDADSVLASSLLEVSHKTGIKLLELGHCACLSSRESVVVVHNDDKEIVL